MLRGGSLAYAEKLGLSLPERYLVGVLLDRGRCSLGMANEILAYMGLAVADEVVARLRARGLIAGSGKDGDCDELSLTGIGREAVIAMIALTKSQNAEIEMQLGDNGGEFKQLLRLLIAAGDISADQRMTQHVETMRNLEVVAH